MVASSASASRKEYLKRYENSNEEEKKKKKKKKKTKLEGLGVVVVDEDPVWQKPVKVEEETDDSSDEEKPQIDEDIEVKRMKRLEQLKTRRPFGAISEDGSGWISVDAPKYLNSDYQNSDMSPPRKRRARNDTPSPEPELRSSGHGGEVVDSSPSLQRRKHYCTPSPEGPEPDRKPSHSSGQDPKHLISSAQDFDISPPRKQRARYDTPSPDPDLRPSESGRVATDLSPPRRQRKHHHTPSPEPETKASRSSGPDPDFSPPRRPHPKKLVQYDDLSPRRSNHHSTEIDAFRVSSVSDLSPPRKIRKESFSLKEKPKTGLITGQAIKEENAKTKRDDWLR